MPRLDFRRGAPTRSRGVTLIELVVVISILGVLAGVIGPRFFDQTTFFQRGYADELAAALRATQKAAVISGCPARLTLAAGSYTASQQAASGNGCNPSDATWSTAVLGPTGTPVADTAPSGITASPTGTFQFNTQGGLSSYPGTTITVGTHTLTVDTGTGYVQVQ